MIRLDIGCSHHKLPGYIGVDLEKSDDVDLIADLHALPFADSTVDEVYSRHTMEHVLEPQKCIAELYRAVKPAGKITIIVPHYSNHAYWADVTHLRPFSVRSFEYYNLEYAKNAGFPIYLPEVNLKTNRVLLTYWPKRIYINKNSWKRLILSILDRVISGFANWNQFLCERLWCYWVGGFYEVTFVLEPIKDE